MNKFVFNACLYEVYKEILFITTNYEKEKIGKREIDKLQETEYKELSKSKIILNFADRLTDMDTKEGTVNFDPKFLEILGSKEINKESLTYVVDYLNKYVDEYLKVFHELTDRVAYTLDLRRGADGYKGNFPVYLKLEENFCFIERAVISLNTLSYINKEANKLSFKITYVEYAVPLEEYKFQDKDLRELDKKEILNIFDSSIKINLANANYYNSGNMELKLDSDDILPDKGELAVLTTKRLPEQETFKSAVKESLKRTLKTIGIIAIITILFYIVRYIFLN